MESYRVIYFPNRVNDSILHRYTDFDFQQIVKISFRIVEWMDESFLLLYDECDKATHQRQLRKVMCQKGPYWFIKFALFINDGPDDV